MKEIERKFLLEKIPENIYIVEKQIIEQFYICSENDIITRVRKIDNNYNIGFKQGKGIERREKEISISEVEFDELRKFNFEKRIKKHRHFSKYENLIIQIDEFRDKHEGLIMAEIEFENLEQAENFTPPNWFGKEVTDDIKYTNAWLSKQDN